MASHDAMLSFSTSEEEIRWLKNKVAELNDALGDLQTELADFAESSKEVEKEMDRELQDAYKREKDARIQAEKSQSVVEDWKAKYQNALAEHNRYHAETEKETAMVKEQLKRYKATIRDMEVSNEELENAERMIASSLHEREANYNKALERTVLLEEELIAKGRLEDDNQRLKDEIQDLSEELGIAREKLKEVQAQNAASSRAVSRAGRETPVEGSGKPNGDMSIAELMSKPRPSTSTSVASSTSRPSSRVNERLSPIQGSVNTRPPSGAPLGPPASSAKLRGTVTGHVRRSSRDIGATCGEDSPSLRASRLRRDLPATSRVGFTPARTRVGSTRVLSTAENPTGSSSKGMMQAMQARMKALDSRISSARNMSKVAPASELDRSAIPRPSSRLGESRGPGGLSSPGPYTTPAPVRTSRASFDGRGSQSGIPVPPTGLSKSTARRPGSRLSQAPGGSAADSPPQHTIPLPRSITPLQRPSSQSGHNHNNDLDLLNSAPEAKTPPGTAARVRRVSTTTRPGGASASIRPRGSTLAAASGAIPRPSTTATEEGANILLESSARVRQHGSRPASGAMRSGPPVSWNNTAGRTRSGSFGQR
ncbi:LIS1-interacting protein NUDE [Ceraceosorus bombacis]|uniref:LIS1-interacting protein NUDE n=1 Tax=Ceraceosorus bombacis TaxID=401625 RepID=A0A0P1BPD3_9BASI|nr:LIS1-interacting protein NUDE [Ceraceosorus bombacis]